MDDYSKSLIEDEKQSSQIIKSMDLKNRLKNPFLPTIVIDDFYEAPSIWRDFAIKQEYFKGNRGSWPGLRTELLHTLNPELFNVVYRKLLSVLKEYGFSEFLELQVAFQSIDETYGRGWVHDDDPKLNVAGLVYLNKTASKGCGTTLYDDQTDFNGETYTKIFMEDVLESSPEQRELHAKYRDEQISHFTPNLVIENKYNRCIIFDPRNWHSADNFFGTTKEDARLTQVFFIRAI